MAGLIYGISSGHSATEIIGYAAAAAFAKLQEKGDATQNIVEKIKTYLANPIIN